MARKRNPWDRGFIPPSALKTANPVELPLPPEGWVGPMRTNSRNFIYQDIDPWGHGVEVVGHPRTGWTLTEKLMDKQHFYLTVDGRTFASPDFDTVVRWWSIEKSLEPDPAPQYKRQPAFYGAFQSIPKWVPDKPGNGRSMSQLGMYRSRFGSFEEIEKKALAQYCQTDAGVTSLFKGMIGTIEDVTIIHDELTIKVRSPHEQTND